MKIKAKDLMVGHKVVVGEKAGIVSDVMIHPLTNVVNFVLGTNVPINVHGEVQIDILSLNLIKAKDLSKNDNVLIVDSNGDLKVSKIVRIKHDGNNINFTLWSLDSFTTHKNDRFAKNGNKTYQW